MSNVPENFKYAITDEWASIDGDIATIGITDYAQDQLSDIVFWEATVEVGENITKGSPIATLESVKAAADVNSPVSGSVIEISQALADTPELVNSDPYGEAWMIKVKLENPSELDSLMDAAAYEKDIAGREH